MRVVLDVSKIEAGKMRLAEEPIDLAGHVRETVLLMESIAIGKDVDLTVTIDEALPSEVIGDSLRLQQVILNLVGNALKFTERGSVTVAVTAAAQGGERLIRFDVSDTGTGIESDQLERIFDRFTQADDDRAVVHGGTGLGLAICAQLARLMGGRIEVESRPGEGSTFSLLVPLKTRGAASHGLPDASRAAAQKPVRPGYRLLVAEDNEINRELMLAIGGHVGLDLVMAVDGEDALRLVDEARANGEWFDLVLMDLQMPRLDGLATTRAIRARGIGADDLPIVALSARAYREDVEECLSAGMQGHLAKPMSIAKLNEAIERFATRPRPVGERASSAPAIDPALQRKFTARKVGALSLLRTALERDTIDETLIVRIVDELHKLAGTAGFFGEDELGRLAADLEARLKRAGPADRRAALADGAPRLLRAA